MAVARPQATRGGTEIKIALIVFVCLTLASLTFAIILYTHQSDLEARVTRAENEVQHTQQNMRADRRALSDFAEVLVGEPTDDVEKMRTSIASITKDILEDTRIQEANVSQEAAVLTLLQDLYDLFSTNTDQLADMTQQRDQLKNQLAQLTKNATDRAQAFGGTTEELTKKYQDLEEQGAQNRNQWNEQVAQLAQQLEETGRRAAAELQKVRTENTQLGAQLALKDEQIDQLKETRAGFRPKTDELAVLKLADGNIVRAMAMSKIAYISLGRKDNLRTGMTFAVYSPVRGVPPDGKGKANIEVSHLFENTAECRITMSTPGDPILEGDLIVNPVYERSRKLSFAVVGDFDLDFDGQAEDLGGDRVAKLIKGAGGKVVQSIDTRTDFVVLGAAPKLLAELPEDVEDPALQERARRQQALRDEFDAAQAQAQGLSVPILTRTQFLHFIGQGVPTVAGG